VTAVITNSLTPRLNSPLRTLVSSTSDALYCDYYAILQHNLKFVHKANIWHYVGCIWTTNLLSVLFNHIYYLWAIISPSTGHYDPCSVTNLHKPGTFSGPILTLRSPVITICTTYFNILISTFCPQSVSVCFHDSHNKQRLFR
jgi:hypothetical protein